ncbi:MAG: molybdate ABC transporter substrate-binding protein [Bacteroidota bacterium]
MRIAIICLGLFLLGCTQEEKQGVRVATAANVQFAMERLAVDFEAKSGYPVEIILGSSGKLKAQIEQGAPFDVFLSADVRYPEELHKSIGYLYTPKTYAYGKLVLWSLDTAKALEFPTLVSPGIRHIALANPKTAPYGAAAQLVLQNLALTETLQDKLVYGESISQVNQFVVSQTADLGFTARSVVTSPKMQSTGQWIPVADSLYTPIAQAALLLQRDSLHGKPSAQEFYEYLFTEAAQGILEEFGYGTLEDSLNAE